MIVLSKFVEKGLQLGALYLDIRLEKHQRESIVAEDGEAKEASNSVEYGVGVRALAGGSWGFAASKLQKGMENRVITLVVEDAVKLARAIKDSSQKIELAKVNVVRDKITNNVKIKPEQISLEENLSVCLESSGKMLKYSPLVKKAFSSIHSSTIDKVFSSSEGAFIQQNLTIVYGSLYAQAIRGSVSEYYSHLTGGLGGFEQLKEYDLVEHADEIAKKAVTLVNANPAPTEKLPVVLDPEFVCLLCHEILGHPSEADRIIGKEAAWAGRSWWQGQLGKKLFSENLTVVSDATLEGYLGSFKYDDEGVPTKRVTHVEKGIIRSYLHSRETAKIFNVDANGAVRASSYLYAPLIRMTNTYVERGDWTFQEIIEDIKEGIYLKGEKIPSIDSRRYNFQISAKEAYMICNGEITEPLRSPTLTGTSPEFLSSIDAVGEDLQIFPIPNCGKGDPMQTMYVGNGGPSLRGYGMVTGPR